MSEHTYRMVMGSALLVLLYTEIELLAYVLIGFIFFEGITNCRLNILISCARNYFSKHPQMYDNPPREDCRIKFDAERAQRLIVAISFAVLFIYTPQELWIVNWMFAFGMVVSGIVMFCPIIALFRAVGFR